MDNDRRGFLHAATAVGVAAVGSLAVAPRAEGKAPDDKKEADEEISAPEDLMREHGVLNRILLVFEEGVRRLRRKEDVPPDVFHKPATLVRTFVEDYHEKLEEKFIFPPFEKHKRLTDLVTVLRQQHEAGRKLTDVILHAAVADRFGRADARQEVVRACEAFVRMYRPHEAREDTVLFPALYTIVPAKEVKELGERFEEEEHRLFGEDGFAKAVEQVAGIEKQLGIYDLAGFTPK
ncbi:MAG TPA: hemerythrin domain-containing protein [Fimbriiglobus sp.]|nr:hemerythrin domain-containing protein [Fimbriiglobus sp.]